MKKKPSAKMYKTIKITDEIHNALVEIGTKSETFSDVISKCVEAYKKDGASRH